MPPTIHLVCEASYAKLHPNGDERRDPSITAAGQRECLEFREKFFFMDKVRMVFSSPLRRAIQTAQSIAACALVTGAAQLVILRRDLKGIGINGGPNFIGSPCDYLFEELGPDLDARDLYSGWWWEGGEKESEEQARLARVHIRKAARELADDEHIIVVVHGEFLKFLVEGLYGLANTWYKACRFVDLDKDDDEALLEQVHAEPNHYVEYLERIMEMDEPDERIKVWKVMNKRMREDPGLVHNPYSFFG
ncbi:histidine phosphatase superfamily [Astrocystis sublimbata]|nr:histidine phosphatase superfamily [Astrocystis sublimbata]